MKADRSGGPDGVLLLDKPAGITSTRALAKAKRLLGSLKGGHTGTLDPFATGLLPLVFGEATKFSRFLIDSEKSYMATLRLGEETPTGDTESAVATRREVDVSDAAIEAALRSFLGVQAQIPPMHSAVHVGGRRLYDYARAGEEVERPARTVEILELARLARRGDDLDVRVRCSKGTYVRTLAQDIGARLGCGAHLVALRRTAVGGFDLDQAIGFETLEGDGIPAARLRLLVPEVLVASLARLDAGPDDAVRFGHGQEIGAPSGPGAEVAVFGPGGRFLGVASRVGEGRLAPLRLVSTGGAKHPDFA
ncbi:MAG TPA: tRNA pseudouridine(55) synthase TruB [Usitatibacter sp.]|nr:tRNA pseudouridine(55) synthase TruB [Usitatibacter sp.]